MDDVTIGNQQPSLTDMEMGWLCGIIDGEGCIYMAKRRENEVRPGVRIAMCDHDTIEYLAELLTKLGVSHHITKRDGNPKKNTSDSWAIVVEGHKRVLKLLPHIAQHLVTKKRQAQVVWQFCEQRSKKWHREAYDDSDLALIAIAKEMNQRGAR